MKTRLPLYVRSALDRAAVFILGLALVTAFALWRERAQALEFAGKSGQATVALMEQHTASTFRVVEVALSEIAGAIETGHPQPNDVVLREGMRQRLKDMPFVRALFVAGPDGTIEHDTDYPTARDVSVAQRDYFRAYVAEPQLDTGVFASVRDGNGGWFVAVTRRVGGPGRFSGVAVAAIEMRYFAQLYERMGLGKGQRIALFHRDGRLLAQYPPSDDAGGARTVMTLVPGDAGGESRAGELTLRNQLVSWRTVQGEPLVVAVTQDVDAVLAPWRRTAIGAAAALLVLLVLTTVAVYLYIRNARERQQARERAAQGEKLEAIGRLTGSVAHDFANVLGIINNNLALLERLGPADEERKARSLEVARQAVATGTQLTRDLMSFARKREVEPEVVDLPETVAAMLTILRQAAGSGVFVELQRSYGLPECRVDTTQLQLALINLLVNARDAMHGKGRVSISFEAQERAAGGRRPGLFSRGRRVAWVRMTVADNGPGMSEDVRRRAFEPFFTTKGEDGTGFGLAQVYAFVRQLGGEAAIESEPGQGTRVYLDFPAQPAPAPAPAVTSGYRRGRGT